MCIPPQAHVYVKAAGLQGLIYAWRVSPKEAVPLGHGGGGAKT